MANETPKGGAASCTASPAKPSAPNAELLVGPRYSPNLRKWARNKRHSIVGRQPTVFRDPTDGVRYIGHRFDDDGWCHAAKLMRVLCVGSKAEAYAYSPEQSGHWEPIADFWHNYAAVGRCAIDPEHTGWWMGDRWSEDGDNRTCLWCGLEQRRECWTETVERERWVAASGMEARQGGDANAAPSSDGSPIGEGGDAQLQSDASQTRDQ